MKAHVERGGLHRGWAAHPAARMWAGHLNLLMTYQVAVCAEWARRGYKDTCLDKTLRLFNEARPDQISLEPPTWMGKKLIHSVHRANLLRKDFDFYKRYNWKEQPMEGYWWPVLKDGTAGFIEKDA